MKTLLLLLLTSLTLAANPDRFRELFADPETRTEALGMLTPGTEPWYFHTALDHQLQGRAKEYEATIRAWDAASKKKEKPVDADELDTLEMRRMLLRYDSDPKGALKEIADEWGYAFDHTKPDSAAEEKSLPTVIDPAWISAEAFRNKQSQLSRGTDYQNYSQAALFDELDQLKDFSREKIDWYARHFQLAHHPGYVDLLARALTQKNPLRTGSIRFDRLTLAQMGELRRKVPTLGSSELFNEAHLAKLRPPLPTNLERHTEAHAAYLAKCWNYAKDLPESQVGIKAYILHHHLRLQQLLGNHPREELYTYLSMPRRQHRWIRSTKEAEHYTSFSRRLYAITECSQVVEDDYLIETYLQHLLADSDKIDPKLSELIKKERLAELHARARILAGADPETYAPILGAEAYRELREETRVEFADNVQREFKSSDKVRLPVLLKNTPTLLIRIYELQGRTAHRAEGADMDLDGLVPHHTRSLEFEQSPAVQHLEELALPELEGPGDWIVELVSRGISARALIRKGLITPYIERVAAGQRVRLFDEHSKVLQKFTIELGSETFTADNGICFIPNAPNSPRTSGLITAGKLSTPIQLGSRSDHIELATRFLLDPEQLLAGKQAKLRLRNSLTNHGRPIGFDQVENASLIMKAELLGGVTTERVIQDSLKLALSNEIEFLVPDNLLTLSLHLSATVRPETDTEPLSLNTSQTYKLNKALQSERIGMALFSPTAEGTVLELRGRNGEPLTSHPINLTFDHVDYKAPITLKLRSDGAGRVRLGKLEGISSVVATSTSIASTRHRPLLDQSEPASEYLVTDKEEIRIPAARKRKGASFVDALLQRIHRKKAGGELVIEDLSSKLRERDGLLTIAPLEPGQYRLSQQGMETRIEVLPEASLTDKLLVTGRLLVTEDRIVPHTHPASPLVATVETGAETLKLQIANASPHTRVSVIGTRYVISDWISGSAVHPFDLDAGPRVSRGSRPSNFITNRRISDEMRYIIDRRSLTRYPGVMLPRPGQLLHRWSPEDIEQGDLGSNDGSDGYTFGGAGAGFGSQAAPRKRRNGTNLGNQQLAIDFLDQTASIAFYIMPDPDGRIEIPAANFMGAQYLHIIASDLKASDERIIALKPSDPALRDRRLSRPLGAKSHHIATRSAASLAPGAEAEIRNLLDADWRAFTTLEQAHQFLLGSTGSDTLRRFVFLTQWPELKEEEKLKLLSQHHCHELHLFLKRKDRAFFDKHVAPLLQAKAQPQFMDDYLLERDLSAYLQIHAFAKLNAAEKALLARAVPDSRKTIARELELRWQNEAPAAEAQTVLFTKTLKGADLDQVDSLGMAYIRGIRKANELLVMADGHYNLGKYDEAKRTYEKVLGIDPYNVTARRGLERVAAVKSDYFRAAYDHTRAEMLSQVDEAWEIALPDTDAGISNIAAAGNRSGDYAIVGNTIDAALNNPNGAAIQAFPTAPANPSVYSEAQFGVPYISEKMRHIIIPSINFEDTTLTDAIEFLRQRAAELDAVELDPAKRGVNFVVRGGGNEPRIDELRVRNVPLEVALKYICDAAKVRYKVDNYAVTITPQTETGEDIFTRTYTVPPDFHDSLVGGDTEYGEVDPFAPAGGGGAAIAAKPDIMQALKRSGVSFPEGSSVTLTGNKLLVSNSPTELDKIEQLTQSLSGSAPTPENAPNFGALFDRPELAQAPPRFVDHTRSWLESNYYKHRGETGEELIPLNRFWLELSAWDGKGAFTSPHFNSCTASDSDALMCLALLDLPFSAEAPEISVEEQSLKIKARAPMLLFYKDTRETDRIAAESPLLVRQTYHPLSEPFRTENGKQVENTHIGDFRTGTAYGLSLVITNPSGIERRIETLAQIPAGAIPLTPTIGKSGKDKDAPTTLSTAHNLEPFGVIRLQLAFYFPSAGDYSAYPLHVAEDGIILAHADARTLRVVNEPQPEDSASWSVIARDGTNEAVLNRLKTGDPADIDLKAILWRLKDRKFFKEVTAILRKRLWNSEGVEDVFSYGIYHDDAAAITDMLEYDNYGSLFGAWLDCKLLKVTPAANHGWEIIEFDPLVNPRSHAFGDQARFTHEAAHEYYQDFLDKLAWKPKLSDSDQFTFTCLLLLQDRTAEALERFAKIRPEGLPDRLQYDYLHSVILFLQEKPAEAAAIAKPYIDKLPPGVWLDRFSAVLTQADEISKPLEPVATPETAEFASLAIVQDSEKPEQLLIKHRRLESTEIRLYHIDLEILFSKDPFLAGGVDTSLPPIEPNLVVDVPLDKEAESTPYLLPEAFRKGNILVAAESGKFKRLKIMDSQALDLHFDPVHRTLQVFDTATNQALPKTYIKVYRELDDGRVQYHKDGYTDLRGKFDYISHTAEKPSSIKRLAILVSHPDKGARTTIIQR